MEPVSNYLVAFGGNPQVISAITHTGNLVPHTIDRTSYNENGELDVDRHTGLAEKCVIGSPRPHFPLREDMKIQIMQIVRKTLQVDNRAALPSKMVRYPQEVGDAKAKILNRRVKWLMDRLKRSRAEAQDLAQNEYFHFFQPENHDPQDPLGSLTEVNITTEIMKITNFLVAESVRFTVPTG